MKLIIYLLCFNNIIKLTCSQPSQITYASGNFTKFDYVKYSFWLYHKNTYTGTLTFPGTFANPPKVIIFPQLYDMATATNEFSINISSISKTQCTFLIAATLLNWARTFSYIFNWIAVDDMRIEVFDCFYYNFTNQVDQEIVFSHTNMNALQGFVTISTLGFQGPINYSLQIKSITFDTVIVSFKTSNTNLLSIGYQVVIGTPEAFQQSNLLTSQITSSVFYNSDYLPIPAGYELFLPLSAMSYDNKINLRLNQTVTVTPSTINYILWCWATSYLDILSHQQVWMNKQNTKYYLPLQLKSMRATKLFQFGIDNYRWKLSIPELNLKFTAASTQTLLIDKNIQILTLKYTYQCIPNGRAYGTVLKCASCVTRNQKFNQYCYEDINFINFNIRLYQADLIYEYINLIVTNQGFSIEESVMNQNGSVAYSIITFSILV